MDDNVMNDCTVEDGQIPVRNESEVVVAHSDNPDYPDSRLAGLKPYQKDQVGNPNGRPKGSKDSPRAALHRLMAKNASIEEIEEFGMKVEAGNHPLKAEVMAQILWLQVKAKDMVAIKEAYAQLELPHPKNVNLNGDFNVSIPSQFADAF